MRVFRRHMNVHCVRVKLQTPFFSENGAALTAKWEIFPQDIRSGKYMLFKTAR